MNEGVVPHRESLRGAETLSPDLSSTLRDAVNKFAIAYKIRQAAGYQYARTNAVDGNFPLRMQYGQLREEIKRLGRRLDAGEQLDIDDYRVLVKKERAFNTSYEKILQYAEDNNIEIPEVVERGEESRSSDSDSATIIEPMETPPTTHTEGVRKLQLAADVYDSQPAESHPAATAGEVPNTIDTALPSGVSPERQADILAKVREYEAAIAQFRTTLTDTAVDSHPKYQEFVNHIHKIRSLLLSSRSEHPAVVAQQAAAEESHIHNLYTSLYTDLKTRREEFEQHFGPEMSSLRDAMEDVPLSATTDATAVEQSPKKTGWFDAAYRRAQGVEQTQITDSETQTQDNTVEPYQLTPDMEVGVGTADTSAVEDTADGGKVVDEEEVAPDHRPAWQVLQDEQGSTEPPVHVRKGPYVAPKVSMSVLEGIRLGSKVSQPQAVPPVSSESTAKQRTPASEEGQPSIEKAASTTEQPATILGLELPASGLAGASAAFVLREELGRMLVVMDKKGTPAERGAVHQAWGVLYNLSSRGMSPSQRQRLVEIAPWLPRVDAKSGKLEAPWHRVLTALPDLSEKLDTADEITKSGWRRRGKQVLLAALLAFGATPTADDEPTSPRLHTPDLDAAIAMPTAPELTATEAASYVVDPTTPFTTVPEDARANPQPLEPRMEEAVITPTPEVLSELATESFGQYQRVDVTPTYDSTIDEVPAEQEAPVALSPVDRILDLVLERQAIEYTFQPDSKIDTVSEAMWDIWNRNAATLQVDSPVSKTQFLSTMWKVISDVEKQPAVYKAMTEKMGIHSGDIHRVFENDTVDLLLLFQKMEAELKAVTV